MKSKSLLRLNAKDYTGMTFGKLTVVGVTNVQNEANEHGWVVECSCGNFELRRIGRICSAFKAGLSPMCKECLVDNKRKVTTIHGLARNDVFNIFKGMRHRCYNPKCKEYPRYGGSGITIYQPWLDNPIEFINYIGPRPSKLHSVDRINNSIGYYPDNIRWATDRQQSRNHTMLKSNKTGHTGVFYKSVELPSGRITEYYVSFIRDNNGKRISKSFRFEKYSPEIALSMAIDWRMNKVIELNSTCEDKYNV